VTFIVIDTAIASDVELISAELLHYLDHPPGTKFWCPEMVDGRFISNMKLRERLLDEVYSKLRKLSHHEICEALHILKSAGYDYRSLPADYEVKL
jgi:hypothetical protein